MAAAQPVCGFHPVVGRQWPAFGCQAAGNPKFGPARWIALGRATGDSVEKVWASQMLWPLFFRQNYTEPSIAVSIAIVFSSRTMLMLIQRAGGRPSNDWTGATGRDEENARARGGPASEARMRRAAEWRRNRSWSRR